MLLKNSNMTFMSIFMYIVPICIDLLSIKPNTNWFFRIIRFILLVFNCAWIVICSAGFATYLTDTGTSFSVVSTAILFSGLTISKRLLSYVLLAELLVPVFLFFGSPTKKQCIAANSQESPA